MNVRPRSDWYAPAVLLGSAVYLYINLFAFPAIPFLLSGDQVYFWMGAQRMMGGERLYLDFFQFAAPGTDVVYLAIFKLFGLHLWVANALVLTLGVGLCWLCFRIANQIMGRAESFLAAWLFLILLYGQPLNATHHWFSALAVLLAIACLMRATDARGMVIAGMLLGLASFFTQTRGPIAGLGIAAYLVWQRFRIDESWAILLRRIAQMVAASVTTLVLLSAYFIHSVGLSRLWFFQITYARKFMVGGRNLLWLGLPKAPTLHNLPSLSLYLIVYTLLPVVYAIVMWRCWLARRKLSSPSPQMDRVALLALTGLAMSIEVAMSLNWLRLFCVAMPGIILLIWVLGQGRFRIVAMGCVWVAILGLAIHQTWSRRYHGYVVEDLPAGQAAVQTESRERLEWLMQHTHPGQPFFQAPWPGVYMPLGLHNPVFLDALEKSKQTRPEFVDLSIRQLDEQQVQYVLWSPDLDFPDPLLPPESYHIVAFRDFLHSHYHRVETFSNQEEIWERK